MRVEQGFISNDGDFERLEITEDELIDAYVNDELSAQERRQFETRLLTSQRIADRVNFARALALLAVSQSPVQAGGPVPAVLKPKAQWWEVVFGRSAAFPTALAACAGIILIAAGFLLFSWFQLRRESQQLATERTFLQRQKEETDRSQLEQRTTLEQRAADLQKEHELLAEERKRINAGQDSLNPSIKGLSGAIVSLMLSPGVVRDAGKLPQIRVGSEAARVRLELLLQSSDYPRYQVAITDSRNRPVITQPRLSAKKTGSGYVVSLEIPAKKLGPGTYLATLRGQLPNGKWEDVEEYLFRAVK